MVDFRRPRRVAAALMALSLLVAGCCVHASVPSEAEMTRSAQALSRVLPTLTNLQVREFRDSGWCRRLEYRSGTYSNQPGPGTACDLPDQPTSAFDSQATTDWNALRQALRKSGVSVETVSLVAYDSAGQLSTASFNIRAGDFDDYFYVYDRRGVVCEPPNPNTLLCRQIDDDWWFVSEDWN